MFFPKRPSGRAVPLALRTERGGAGRHFVFGTRRRGIAASSSSSPCRIRVFPNGISRSPFSISPPPFPIRESRPAKGASRLAKGARRMPLSPPVCADGSPEWHLGLPSLRPGSPSAQTGLPCAAFTAHRPQTGTPDAISAPLSVVREFPDAIRTANQPFWASKSLEIPDPHLFSATHFPFRSLKIQNSKLKIHRSSLRTRTPFAPSDAPLLKS